MGTSGVIMGSNTAFFIEQSTVLVLAIPQDSVYSKPEKIVYATDYNESDIDDLNELAFLAGQLNSEIIVVHIDKPGEATSNSKNTSFPIS